MAAVDHAVAQERPSSTETPSQRVSLRGITLVVGALAVAAVAIGAVRLHLFASDRVVPTPLPAPTPLASVSDLRPVTVRVTTPDWTKERHTVTMARLRSDFTLWRQMHFNDWDLLPAEIRRPAVLAMIRAHEGALRGPQTWGAMTAGDWDQIPQPVRAMAFLRMIWFWAVAEDVGSEFGLQPRIVAHTIGAIVMAESWFDHRAFNQNQWGNRDLGLAQCSDHCRKEIIRMHDEGLLSFSPTEAEYLDPWVATRVATVWLKREIANAAGDVDVAIRAYHRGIDNAMDQKGDAYLARVQSLRERYISAQTASATWRLVTRELASR